MLHEAHCQAASPAPTAVTALPEPVGPHPVDEFDSMSVRELKNVLDRAGVPYGDISEKSDLVLRARGTQQSEDDEAFARRLQAEMDAEMEGAAAPRPAPSAEEVAALEEDEALAHRLQAELYADEGEQQRIPTA